MELHSEAARLHLAKVSANTEGLRQQSTTWMSNEGILDPDSMARAMVPE
jgi:hypothetical protein